MEGKRKIFRHRKVILVLIIFLLSVFAVSKILMSEEKEKDIVKNKQSLRKLAEKDNFFIGTAINAPAFLKDKQYKSTVKEEFNLITIENELKFTNVHPQRNKYDFLLADFMVEFARENNQKVRGHTLVWGQSLPDWIIDNYYSKEELKKILKNHIQTVVGHYKGKIYAWDVVNEAFTDGGKLRDNVWLRVIGPEYIELAFRWAHEADPNALLFYNDYNNAGLSPKTNAIYETVKSLKTRGVPIDGIGFQSHVTTNEVKDYEAIDQNIKRLSNIGIQVEITEMDVKIPVSNSVESTSSKLEKQSEMYSDTLDVCLANRNCNAFVMWGFTDKYTGMGKENKPLIFDDKYRPKPAYKALYQNLLQNNEK